MSLPAIDCTGSSLPACCSSVSSPASSSCAIACSVSPIQPSTSWSRPTTAAICPSPLIVTVWRPSCWFMVSPGMTISCASVDCSSCETIVSGGAQMVRWPMPRPSRTSEITRLTAARMYRTSQRSFHLTEKGGGPLGWGRARQASLQGTGVRAASANPGVGEHPGSASAPGRTARLSGGMSPGA